jgi:hypothetical protein
METAGSRNLRAVEPKAGHELTFKLDHSVGAAHAKVLRFCGVRREPTIS